MLNVLVATVLYTLMAHNYIRFFEQQNYGMPRKAVFAPVILFATTFFVRFIARAAERA